MCSISPSALYGRRRRRCFFLHNSSLHYGCHIDRSQEGREGAGGRWREVGYWLGSTGGGGRGEKGSRRGEKDEMWSKKKGAEAAGQEGGEGAALYRDKEAEWRRRDNQFQAANWVDWEGRR